MITGIPADLRAEALLNYLSKGNRSALLCGNHKRNAYEDIIGIEEENQHLRISISKNGIYDILPECLFHPIDRFENLPANEYKERFKEECDLEQIEESNARTFFAPFDNFLIELQSLILQLKDSYSDNRAISSIIADRLPDEIIKNRFIARTIEYLPHCSRIRGNRTLLTFMLRKVLSDEGLKLKPQPADQRIEDASPQYNYRLDMPENGSEDLFLGNVFDENIMRYSIQYWSEDDCDANFPIFVEELKTYRQFINDYFVGLESQVEFELYTTTLPVSLSDDLYFNFLDYNTNI